jgi:hypothetical protein
VLAQAPPPTRSARRSNDANVILCEKRAILLIGGWPFYSTLFMEKVRLVFA